MVKPEKPKSRTRAKPQADDVLAEATRLLDAHEKAMRSRSGDDFEIAAQLRELAQRLPDELPSELAGRFFRWFVAYSNAPARIRGIHFHHLVTATQSITTPDQCYLYGLPWKGGCGIPLSSIDTSPEAHAALVRRTERVHALGGIGADTSEENVARARELAQDAGFVDCVANSLAEARFVSAEYDFKQLLVLAMSGSEAAVRQLTQLVDRIRGEGEPRIIFKSPAEARALLEAVERALACSESPAVAELRAHVRSFLGDPKRERAWAAGIDAANAPPPPYVREPIEVELPSDELFWELVALANRDWDRFAERLREQPSPILAGFASMFWGLASAFWQWAQDRTGCSEDGAEDYGGLIVGQGRDYFMRAIQAPHTITEKVLDALEGRGMEIQYEAQTVYRERTGDELTPFDGEHFDVDDSAYGPLLHGALRE